MTASIIKDGYLNMEPLIFDAITVYGQLSDVITVLINGASWSSFTYVSVTKVWLIYDINSIKDESVYQSISQFTLMYGGRLHGLAVARWTTDHYHPCSNPGVGISEGCFVFHFVSLPLELAQPIYPTLCTKVAVKHQSSSSIITLMYVRQSSYLISLYNYISLFISIFLYLVLFTIFI